MKKKKHARASTTGGAYYGIEGEQRGGNETEERIYSPAGLAPQGRPFSLFSLVFQAHREDLQPGTNNKSILWTHLNEKAGRGHKQGEGWKWVFGAGSESTRVALGFEIDGGNEGYA